MKLIETMDFLVNDTVLLHCKDITDVLDLPEPEMVEVAIKGTITKEHYEKLIEEITLQEYLEGLGL
ncbi:hypothetical protein [Bacillus sp. Bos-x628]|uniref:hypothetical protein n=1 Tax=Bacillus maqinnsis TaxID=3229854 RepID=UPI00338E2B79